MSGEVTLKPFHSKHRPEWKWVVYWPSDIPGKPRKSSRFRTKAEAEKFRFEKEIQVTNDGRKAAALRDSVISEAVWASEQLKPLGVTLREVITDYVDRNKRVAESVKLDEAIYEFIDTKKAAKKSARYIQDLRSRCGQFVNAHDGMRMAEIEVADVETWLESLKVEAVTRNNFRRSLSVFFSWGVKRGFCKSNPVFDAERAKEISERVEIFTPAELRVILNAAADVPEVLPFLAIGAFAGLRSSEIERLDWCDVDFLNKRIDVSGKIAKSAANRYVPMWPALIEWLQPAAKAYGKVCLSSVYKRLTAFRHDLAKGKKGERPPLAWKNNGMRHSFASYALAECGDAGQVALWLGHDSTKMIFKHYRERVTPESAGEWFAVLPGEGKVNQIEAVA